MRQFLESGYVPCRETGDFSVQNHLPRPVFFVVFYHGEKPWPGETSLKKGLWGRILSKIPSSLQKSMLDSEIRVLDTHDRKVERAIEDKNTKSRGFLNILKRVWSLRPDAAELKKTLSLFDNWPGDRDSLILGVGNYFWKAVPGMTDRLWEELEREGVKKGIFSKGGYMNTREYIEEEGIQKGIQKRDREIVLNMLQKKADISFISEVTGLSEKEIKKLQKNGSL